MKNTYHLIGIALVVGLSLGNDLNANKITFSCPDSIKFDKGNSPDLKSFYEVTRGNQFHAQISEELQISQQHKVKLLSVLAHHTITWSNPDRHSDDDYKLTSVTLAESRINQYANNSPQCVYTLDFDGILFPKTNEIALSYINLVAFTHSINNCSLNEKTFECDMR